MSSADLTSSGVVWQSVFTSPTSASSVKCYKAFLSIFLIGVHVFEQLGIVVAVYVKLRNFRVYSVRMYEAHPMGIGLRCDNTSATTRPCATA